MSEDALKAARALAVGIDPAAAAARCGAGFDGNAAAGEFLLPFLGVEVGIRFPEFEIDPRSGLPPHVQALLVYHLAQSDGSLPVGEWCSFADLPNARFYARAFQGYTGDALCRRIGGRADGVAEAVAALGGRALDPAELATNADAAWVVPALPRVPVTMLWWDADEEFSARSELLFDTTAASHLPTDGCAVLGSWLTSRVIAGVESSRS